MRYKRRLVSSSMLASCDRLWVVPPLTIYTDFTWTVAQPPLGGSILVAGHHNTRSYYTEIMQKEVAASNYCVKYIFFIFSYNNECTNSINIEHWISYIMCYVPCNLVSAAGTPWSSPAAGGWTLATSPECNISSMFSFSILKFQIHQLDPRPHLTVVKLADVLQLVAEKELEHKQQTWHGERLEVNTDL